MKTLKLDEESARKILFSQMKNRPEKMITSVCLYKNRLDIVLEENFAV